MSQVYSGEHSLTDCAPFFSTLNMVCFNKSLILQFDSLVLSHFSFSPLQSIMLDQRRQSFPQSCLWCTRSPPLCGNGLPSGGTCMWWVNSLGPQEDLLFWPVAVVDAHQALKLCAIQKKEEFTPCTVLIALLMVLKIVFYYHFFNRVFFPTVICAHEWIKPPDSK